MARAHGDAQRDHATKCRAHDIAGVCAGKYNGGRR